ESVGAGGGVWAVEATGAGLGGENKTRGGGGAQGGGGGDPGGGGGRKGGGFQRGLGGGGWGPLTPDSSLLTVVIGGYLWCSGRDARAQRAEHPGGAHPRRRVRPRHRRSDDAVSAPVGRALGAGRRLRELPLCPQSGTRQGAGLQRRRAGRRLHELPVDDAGGSAAGRRRRRPPAVHARRVGHLLVGIVRPSARARHRIVARRRLGGAARAAAARAAVV